MQTVKHHAPASNAPYVSPLLCAGDDERHFGVGPGDLPRSSYFRMLSIGAYPKDERLPHSDFGLLA